LRKVLLCFAAGMLALPNAAGAAETFGPYSAKLVRIVDADTFVLDILLWPGLTWRRKVRLAGYNTPEPRGKVSDCEKREAAKANVFAARFLALGPIKVTLRGRGKYGRPLVWLTVKRQDLARALHAAGLARPYKGGKRNPWCRNS